MRMLFLAAAATILATVAHAETNSPETRFPPLPQEAKAACEQLKGDAEVRALLERIRLLQRTKQLFGSETIRPDQLPALNDDSLVHHSIEVVQTQRRAEDEWMRQFCEGS